MTRKKQPKPLTPQEFTAKHPTAYIIAMCEKAGTKHSYWKHIANKRKRPTVDLARALVSASGGELDLESLLYPKEQKRPTGAPPMESVK